MSETPIVKRLELLVEEVEAMLERPRTYALSGEALEFQLLIAFRFWKIITDSKFNVRKLWREQIALAWPNSRQQITCLSLPGIQDVGDWHDLDADEQFDLVLPVIVKHMKVIWDKIKNESGE